MGKKIIMQQYFTREDAELNILNEKPYNWVKHFLFDLPDLLMFGLKLLVLFFIVEVVIVSMLATVIVITFGAKNEEGIKGIINNIQSEYDSENIGG